MRQENESCRQMRSTLKPSQMMPESGSLQDEKAISFFILSLDVALVVRGAVGAGVVVGDRAVGERLKDVVVESRRLRQQPDLVEHLRVREAVARVAARPRVQEVLRREGLLDAA